MRWRLRPFSEGTQSCVSNQGISPRGDDHMRAAFGSHVHIVGIQDVASYIASALFVIAHCNSSTNLYLCSTFTYDEHTCHQHLADAKATCWQGWQLAVYLSPRRFAFNSGSLLTNRQRYLVLTWQRYLSRTERKNLILPSESR